jgi:hypothetical protein
METLMATQTTTTLPPAYQLPYLQYGLGQAKSLYDQGSQVVPFSPYSERALQGTAQRAQAGSPLTDAAQQYAQKSLQGGFLGSNPYLDQTFEQARLATQNGLSSEFARSGRNVGASEGLRSQQMGDLATKIYGGAYGQERQLQQGVLGQATGLANQDYVDLAQLRGVGSDVEGLAREYQQAPQQALDQYLGRVGGIPAGSTTTSPLYRNSAGSALGGALIGSQLGSSVSNNPYAGLFGGLIGGAAGYFGGG